MQKTDKVFLSKKWCLCLLAFGLAFPLKGQHRGSLRPDEIFEAGLIMGLNLSQIDGDYFTGFNKAGWYGGLRSAVNLSRQSSLYLEMLYSQKGSRIPHGVKLDSRIEIRDRMIDLHYIDVPILFHFQFAQNDKSGFFEVGPVFSRLIQVRIEEKAAQNIAGTIYREVQSDFKRSDPGLLLGAGIPFTNNLGLTIRYQYALGPFYENEDFMPPRPFSSRAKEVAFLRNYHLSLALSYRLFSTRR